METQPVGCHTEVTCLYSVMYTEQFSWGHDKLVVLQK